MNWIVTIETVWRLVCAETGAMFIVDISPDSDLYVINYYAPGSGDPVPITSPHSESDTKGFFAALARKFRATWPREL